MRPRGMGLDVVITDHHLPPPVLPRAVAVVDPHRPDCAYPDQDLTGAGLSYKLAAALLDRHWRRGRRPGGDRRHRHRCGRRADDRREPRDRPPRPRGAVPDAACRPARAPRAWLRRPRPADRARSRLRGRAADQRRRADRRRGAGDQPDARGGRRARRAPLRRARGGPRAPSRADEAGRGRCPGAGRGAGDRAVARPRRRVGAGPRRVGRRAACRTASRDRWPPRRWSATRCAARSVRRRTSMPPRPSRPAPHSSRSEAVTPRPADSACCRRRGTAFSAAFTALPRPFPMGGASEPVRPGRVVVDLVLPARLRGLDAVRAARAPRAVRSWPRRAGPGGDRHGAHGGAAPRRTRAARCAADAARARDVRHDRVRTRAGSAAAGAGRCGRPRRNARARRLRRDAAPAAAGRRLRATGGRAR